MIGGREAGALRDRQANRQTGTDKLCLLLYRTNILALENKVLDVLLLSVAKSS